MTTIQKQGLILYQLVYCCEMLLYVIVVKWIFSNITFIYWK